MQSSDHTHTHALTISPVLQSGGRCDLWDRAGSSQRPVHEGGHAGGAALAPGQHAGPGLRGAGHHDHSLDGQPNSHVTVPTSVSVQGAAGQRRQEDNWLNQKTQHSPATNDLQKRFCVQRFRQKEVRKAFHSSNGKRTSEDWMPCVPGASCFAAKEGG